MKFNCGPDRRTRERENWHKNRLKRLAMLEWHPKFAWWPVRVSNSNKCVWLEMYETRVTHWIENRVYDWEIRIKEKQ